MEFLFPKKYQTTKGSISDILKGDLKVKKGKPGIAILKGKGWDYAGLDKNYMRRE